MPTCPGWRVRDLIRHTGMVHRWATGMVVDESRTCREAADEPALDATGKRSGSGARHGHPAGLAAPRPAHRAAPLRLTRR
ncbi:maleylpyruvate isomerase N-terminal domain-containing protein [Streptomyces sp. JAC128]|uniref:maleylpyruvate isomerase N-terminal domain-containing protein n=1 Tax=Streptomyces sp. JAC128 TaxID=3418412 RepID=UPI003D818162